MSAVGVSRFFVTPAKAGVQLTFATRTFSGSWIPAFAGMTEGGVA